MLWDRVSRCTPRPPLYPQRGLPSSLARCRDEPGRRIRKSPLPGLRSINVGRQTIGCLRRRVPGRGGPSGSGPSRHLPQRPWSRRAWPTRLLPQRKRQSCAPQPQRLPKINRQKSLNLADHEWPPSAAIKSTGVDPAAQSRAPYQAGSVATTASAAATKEQAQAKRA
jgi:hypothetical protein